MITALILLLIIEISQPDIEKWSLLIREKIQHTTRDQMPQRVSLLGLFLLLWIRLFLGCHWFFECAHIEIERWIWVVGCLEEVWVIFFKVVGVGRLCLRPFVIFYRLYSFLDLPQPIKYVVRVTGSVSLVEVDFVLEIAGAQIFIVLGVQQVNNIMVADYLFVGSFFDIEIALKFPYSFSNIFIDDFVAGG